jgi:large subunit ribosomal protein L10
MDKTEKSLFVTNLTEELKGATSIVLVNHSGLSVKMQQDLKKRLKEAGARMEIVKNTLFKLAVKESKVDENVATDTVLTGPVALVITDSDPIAPLQILAKFAKEFEVPQLKVGLVEGKFQDSPTLIRLSTLPSKEVLYAQVVGGVSAPLYGLVGTLQGNLQKLLFILDQASKK